MQNYQVVACYNDSEVRTRLIKKERLYQTLRPRNDSSYGVRVLHARKIALPLTTTPRTQSARHLSCAEMNLVRHTALELRKTLCELLCPSTLMTLPPTSSGTHLVAHISIHSKFPQARTSRIRSMPWLASLPGLQHSRMHTHTVLAIRATIRIARLLVMSVELTNNLLLRSERGASLERPDKESISRCPAPSYDCHISLRSSGALRNPWKGPPVLNFSLPAVDPLRCDLHYE
jgi:hypothetical protein